MIHGYPCDVCLQGRAFNVQRAQGTVGWYARYKDNRTCCKGKCWGNKFFRLPTKKTLKAAFLLIFFRQVGSKFYIPCVPVGARRTPPFRLFFSRNVKRREAEVASKRASQVFHAWLTQAIWGGEMGRCKTPQLKGQVSIKIRWIRWINETHEPRATPFTLFKGHYLIKWIWSANWAYSNCRHSLY